MCQPLQMFSDHVRAPKKSEVEWWLLSLYTYVHGTRPRLPTAGTRWVGFPWVLSLCRVPFWCGCLGWGVLQDCFGLGKMQWL